MFKNKKVLVTGGAGLTGSHLAEELLNRGANVRVTKFSSDIQYDHSNLEIVQGDLRDVGFCGFITEQIDYVFHCAVRGSGTKEVSENPIKYISSNLSIDTNILESSIRNRVKKFSYISSAIVYPDSDWAMEEEDALEPDSYNRLWPASETKRYMERICRFMHHNTDMDICIVRPSNIYGPRDNFDIRTAQVLPALVNRIYHSSGGIEIGCSENVTRDFLYVKDLAKAILLSMEHYCCGEPLNIGSGEQTTLENLVENIIKHLDLDISYLFTGDDKDGILVRRMDISKACDNINFKPCYSIEDGLRETIDWWIEHGEK